MIKLNLMIREIIMIVGMLLPEEVSSVISGKKILNTM